MSRNEAQVKPRASEATKPADTSVSTLAKTLEDLERRLSRLSSGKPEPTPAAEATPLPAAEVPVATAGERLRAVAEARRAKRPSLSSAVSTMAVERQLSGDVVSQTPAPKTRAPLRSPTVDRRLGGIAAEVEQLQMQNTAIALIKDLAAELSDLRGDIHARLGDGGEDRISELQASFGDLKRMIEAREAPDRIGDEILEIMESLTELTVGTADQSSLDALRLELDSVAVLVSQMAREESLEAVQQRWDAFETQIAERMDLDMQAKRDLKVELERLRGSLRSLATEDQVLEVQKRWEEFEARYVDTVRIQTEESVSRVLRSELDALRTKLDTLVAESGREALDARFAALADDLHPRELEASVERLSGRMDEIEQALVGLPEILQIDQMDQRIQALAAGVEALTREIREPDLSHLEVIEERLDEISLALASAGARTIAEIDMAPVERIEARVADLAGRIDRLGDRSDIDGLSAQIVALTERVEDLGAQSIHEDLGSRLDTLSERVEVLFRSAGAPDTSAFEARLAALAQRLEASASSRGVDPDVIAGLEAQIERMTELLAGAPGLGLGSDDGAAVTQRLEAIERQLDENRDHVVAAARAAADEAVRRMQDEDVRRESGFVRELAQDLRNLEDLCRESDERSFGIFEAVHATLLRIVERLTLIEGELRGKAIAPAVAAPVVAAPVEQPSVEPAAMAEFEPRSRLSPAASVPVEEEEPKGLRAALQRHIARRNGKAAAVEAPQPTLAERIRPTPIVEEPQAVAPPVEIEAPALDASDSLLTREANRPLEPGSGAPDIAALIERVRQQQRGEQPSVEPMAKADFIAAARKAAMAAASEAEALREREERGEETRDGKGASRRKPILMGVGAVLLALMAVPLGINYLSPSPDVSEPPVAVASLEAPAETALPAPAPMAQAEAPVVADVPATEDAPPMSATSDAVVAEPAAEANAPLVSEPEVPAAAEMASEALEAETPQPTVTEATSTQTDGKAMLVASARSHLPPTAQGAVPALPAGITSEPLVKAVQTESPMAFFEVGLRLMEGRNAPSDPTAAVAWFAQAALRDFAPAQYSLGTLFEKGNGVPRNAAAARDWYRLAAENGNVRAMHNLAVLYATGIDGKSEPATAAEWFNRAAAFGMRDSQYNLGILYARGAGVPQDLATSYRWFGIVGRAGDADAETKKGEVGKTLGEEERARLDAEIAAWKPETRIEEANTVDVPADWAGTPERTASVDMTRAIRNVQAILIKLGYDPGRPDGVAGAQTEAAIRQFQGKAGMEATGKIDERLIRALLERKDA
ncbi:peptidoglycan-binding protein [Aureimonas sp. ME7]|uniref:peptidoglycan-binding protein n=1 Tax=Aureimonas sp. ME7 TaxID=2744252 RepID=UPI0015F692DF|nr:peptidoglycan-binding protein [Aureimonas sp. ME7]